MPASRRVHPTDAHAHQPRARCPVPRTGTGRPRPGRARRRRAGRRRRPGRSTASAACASGTWEAQADQHRRPRPSHLHHRPREHGVADRPRPARATAKRRGEPSGTVPVAARAVRHSSASRDGLVAAGPAPRSGPDAGAVPRGVVDARARPSARACRSGRRSTRASVSRLASTARPANAESPRRAGGPGGRRSRARECPGAFALPSGRVPARRDRRAPTSTSITGTSAARAPSGAGRAMDAAARGVLVRDDRHLVGVSLRIPGECQRPGRSRGCRQIDPDHRARSGDAARTGRPAPGSGAGGTRARRGWRRAGPSVR